MKVSHYWQLRSLHPHSNWSSRHHTSGLKLPSFAFLGSTSQRGHNGRTIHCARGQLTDHFWGNDLAHRLIWGQSMILLTDHFWGNQWSCSSSSIDERHYDGHLRHTSQGWLAAEQKARELPETQISSTLAQVCIILSIWQCDCNGFAHHAQDFFLLHSFPQATSFSSLLAVAGGLLADLLVTVIF